MGLIRKAITGIGAVVLAAGCSHGAATPSATGAPAGARAAALHRAAQCVREHGIPHFQDPTVGANGQVFTDLRPLQDASDATARAARAACQSLISAANWNPDREPPAPPALVAAGAKSADCMRHHGLPNVKDPTASSPYTPGHGFGLNADELPPGADKRSGVLHAALEACRTLHDAENQASTLDHLAGQ